MDEAPTLREFMREIMLRLDRQTKAHVEGFELLARTVHEELAATRANIDDLRAESRAQREALLRILDRLDGGTASA